MNTAPTVEVLGIHRLNITDEWFAQSFVYAYGNGSNEEEGEYERLRSHFLDLLRGVALIEVRVNNRDGSFSMEKFTQLEPSPITELGQAAYLERYLNGEGTELASGSERYMPDPPEGDLRIVFFMHFWNTQVPLETCYGPVECPQPTPMPARLSRLTEYEPVD